MESHVEPGGGDIWAAYSLEQRKAITTPQNFRL